MNVPYALRSGKNAKFPYFLRNSLSLLVPRRVFLGRLDAALSSIQARADAAEIEARAAYCCRLDPRPASAGGPSAPLPDSAPRLREQRLPWKGQVYYFDTREWLRWFPPDLRWMHFPGDVTFVPESPSVVKTSSARAEVQETARIMAIAMAMIFFMVCPSMSVDCPLNGDCLHYT